MRLMYDNFMTAVLSDKACVALVIRYDILRQNKPLYVIDRTINGTPNKYKSPVIAAGDLDLFMNVTAKRFSFSDPLSPSAYDGER